MDMNTEPFSGQEKKLINTLNHVIRSRFITISGKGQIILADLADPLLEGYFIQIKNLEMYNQLIGNFPIPSPDFQIEIMSDEKIIHKLLVRNMKLNDLKIPYFTGLPIINSYELIEISIRILFRLTQKPNGSMVPLWDLLDDSSEKYLTKNALYNFIKYIWQKTSEITPCPVGYDPINAVFKKEDDTFSIIEHLRLSFAEWNRSQNKI